MPLSSRTFRIFVSSTFSDLKEERNALQKYVFPRLRALCKEYGCSFQAIDLRWGVREEAGLDQRTMSICLDEIERCQRTTPRPNFIVFLGDRYGWRPLPREIPEVEFRQIEVRAAGRDDHKMLGRWYKCDENAVPPVFCLQPRRVDAAANASEEEKRAAREEEARAWAKTEKELRRIIHSAVSSIQLSEEGRRRYGTSATDQEIEAGVMKVPDSREHVFCFFRSIRDLPHDASSGDFIDTDEDGTVDQIAQERLLALKQSLKAALPNNVFEYEAFWKEDSASTDHLERLCQDVHACLSRVILSEVARIKDISPLDKEIDDHIAFRKDRARCFVGRTDPLNAIRDYIKGSDPYPFAIWGDAGSGKSALLAKAIELTRAECQNAEIVFRFIGASPGSSDVRSLLEGICRQISRLYEADETDIPSAYKELSEELPKRLALARGENPLIVFVDALDQLSDAHQARSLAWLPARLPVNVKVIVSTLPGECKLALEKKSPEKMLARLEKMPIEEGEELLNLWLNDQGRTLQSGQRAEVLGKFKDEGRPLYLKLAFEEAKRWRSYDADCELKPTIPGIIGQLFTRLSSDANHGEIMVSRSLGYLAAAKNGLSEDELLDVLSLDESVFRNFIERAYHKPPEQRLPVIVWSRLFFDLEPYLSERNADGATLLAFYHPTTMGKQVREDYLAGDAERERHRMLARYFGQQELFIATGREKTPNLRKVSELPFQQLKGEMWDELVESLCALDFIEAKSQGGMAYDLVTDFDRGLNDLPEAGHRLDADEARGGKVRRYTDELILYAEAWSRKRKGSGPDIPLPGPPASVHVLTGKETAGGEKSVPEAGDRYRRMKIYHRFVKSEADGFAKYADVPGYRVQQAFNSASSGLISDDARKVIERGEVRSAFLRLQGARPPFDLYPAQVSLFSGNFYHSDMSHDGTIAIASHFTGDIYVWDLVTGKCLNVLSSPHDVKDKNRIEVWELRTGHCLTRVVDRLASQRVALTPDGRLVICGVDAVTPDGTLAISSSKEENSLAVWDLEKGSRIRTLLAHEGGVLAAAMTPDGRRALSGGKDGRLRLWDLETGASLLTLAGHKEAVGAVALAPDGRRAVSGGRDAILKVWDLTTGDCLHHFSGHKENIQAVAITPDGRLAASGGYDCLLRVWDLAEGRKLKDFEGHTDTIISLALTSDGSRAISVSACDDPTVRVWDVEKGLPQGKADEYRGDVDFIRLSPSGRHAFSIDRSPRLWNVEDNTCARDFQEELGIPRAATFSHNDRHLIVADRHSIGSVWDVASRECIRTFEKQGAPSIDSIDLLTTTPDDRKIISGGWRTLAVWDTGSGECLRTMSYPRKTPKGYENAVRRLSVSPDGYLLMTSDSYDTCRVWDIGTGELLLEAQMAAAKRGRITLSDGRKRWSDILNQSPCGNLMPLLDEGLGVFQRHGDPEGEGDVLQIIEASSNTCLAVLDILNDIITFDVQLDRVAACNRFGSVHFFKAFSSISCVPRTTIVRLFLADKGTWEDRLTSLCPWCGDRFVPEHEVVAKVWRIMEPLLPGQSPCLWLPDEAWEEPQLLSTCPLCQKNLVLNPYIVDNSTPAISL